MSFWSIGSDKQQKRDFIELQNADLVDGRLKILRGSPLANEMLVLQWDDRKKEIDKSCPDHRFHGFLYVCRYLYNHQSHDREVEPTPGTPEWGEKVDDEAFDKASAKYRKHQLEKWWDSLDMQDTVADDWDGYDA